MEDTLLFLAFLFLIGSSLLSGASTSLQILGKLQYKDLFKKYSKLFFFQHFLRFLVRSHFWEALVFTISFTRHIFLLLYATCSFSFLLSTNLFSLHKETASFLEKGSLVTSSIILLVVCSLLVDFSLRFLATVKPKFYFKLCALPVAIFLTPTSPLAALFLILIRKLFPTLDKGQNLPSSLIRDKFLEIIDESDIATYLDYFDQRLILSIASFKERIAREVMIPRVDVFALTKDTSIQEAALAFTREGYSRIPIYHDSVDEIIGILNYKDLLPIYTASLNDKAALEKTVESIVKPVIYTPETKKISHLLQQLRNQQTHLAIVVDEYGGTSGIITIEDILEELVGEISDEYDIEEEALYNSLPDGGWVVDAKMSILDLEKQLKIPIPQSPDYETIGGYISHTAGIIPPQGWKLHHDRFDLEVLSSNERSIEKIRIRLIEK